MAQILNLVQELDGLSLKQAHEIRAREMLERWEETTACVGQVQQQVLQEILSRNACCHYLRKLGLAGRTDADSFRAKVPVIVYEDVETDIRRLAAGETAPLLTADAPVEFLASSGTSAGKMKMFPTVEGDRERRGSTNQFLRPVLSRHVPGLEQGKCLYFFLSRQAETLPGSGLLRMSVLTSYYRSSSFARRPYDPTWVLTSPGPVVLCTDSKQSTYCHLLLGLVQAMEVHTLGAVMASTLVRAIRFLEEAWPELCADIAAGTVSPTRVTDPTLRSACQQYLHPTGDPDLAARVAAACSGARAKAWKGIIPQLWPNVRLLDAVMTGVMEAYVPVLQAFVGDNVAGEGVKLVCGQLYAASECHLGVNMRPLDPPDSVSYTLVPTNAFYEFLPVAARSANGDVAAHAAPVLLTEVEVGREYELVITTFAGLYRYRMGDVLRCTGHYNRAPNFFFVGRASATLCVDYDKTTEREVQFAISKACQLHLHDAGWRLRDYTACCDMTSSPGHYVVFLELESTSAPVPQDAAAATGHETRAPEQDWNGNAHFCEHGLPSSLLEQCCSTMENNFNVVYMGCRQDKTIGPLELKMVQKGAFDELAAVAIARGGSIAQYKTPRCLKLQEMVDLLTSRVVQAFSPQC